MRSLRLKILAVAATLVLLSQAGTVTTVLVIANRDVAERARARLDSGSQIFEQVSRARAIQLGSTVNVLAADYAFKQAVGTRDLATVSSALSNHAQRGRADIAFLLDEAGTIIASTAAAAEEVQLAGLVARANEQGVARSVLVRNDRAYEILTVPVRAPLPVAWVSMGFLIDDSYVRQLESFTGLNATVFVREASGVRVVASTIEPESRDALVAAAASRSGSTTQTLEIAGNRQLAISRPFLADAPEVAVLLTESLDEAMAPYRMLQTAAIVLGMLPLLLALGGAVLLSRSLTRPVQLLAEAARRMKRGDYSIPVTVASGDELGELAVTFNSMQDDIARREARITYQARHDSLTGLPNRDYALEQLGNQIDNVRESGESLTVMIVDLNGIGEIAASLGHDIADAYLRCAAEQLRSQTDPQHVLARLENDSFMLVMPTVGADWADKIARRLRENLERGVDLQDLTVSVRPVIGIAIHPEHGESPDQLLLRATVAQSDVRQAICPIGFYHGGDEERRVRRLTILGDLRRAVRREELQLVYQPKIAPAGGKVYGVEALVRWHHATLGPISPSEFIPIAEQSGNISILTRWALTAAARDCRLWLEEGLDLSVSVNLSAHDLLDKDLPWFVLDVLRNHDLGSRHLIAEITEESVVRDFTNATLVLQRLRELGIRISIDDFGAGYSSLAQLRNLPVDELKIDRSFVQQLPDNRADMAIVRSSIDLAHNLGLGFVAEGVESERALRWLAEHGCELAQGFHISKPLPAADLLVWVRNYSKQCEPAAPALQSA